LKGKKNKITEDSETDENFTDKKQEKG